MVRGKPWLTGGVILLGSLLYAIGTVAFIFPHGLLLGGTSGISVILNTYLPYSPGTILMVINIALLVLAFVTLGRSMAVRNVLGSVLTTVLVGALEAVWTRKTPLIAHPFFSVVVGATVIAIASGLLFSVDASSGGTDVLALIVRKYRKMDVGKALLMTDVLIVLVGGALSGWTIGLSSLAGLLIKTQGIDALIAWIKKRQSSAAASENSGS